MREWEKYIGKYNSLFSFGDIKPAINIVSQV